jgi:hypothetical protein
VRRDEGLQCCQRLCALVHFPQCFGDSQSHGLGIGNRIAASR